MGWRGEAPPFYPSAMHTARDRMALSEITPDVLISNFKGAANHEPLRAMGVTHIASVGQEFVDAEPNDGFTYWNHDITDDDHQGDAMADALHEAAAFVHDGLQKGGKVLVHCAAGISRSVTVVLGWMILHRGMSLRDAFAQCFAARPCIWPNEGFMQALIALEVAHRGGSSTISMEEYGRWGDYDGPLVDGDEGGDVDPQPEASDEGDDEPLLPFFPRLVRDETCLEAEERELPLDEESQRQKRRIAALASTPSIGAATSAEGAAETEAPRSGGDPASASPPSAPGTAPAPCTA